MNYSQTFQWSLPAKDIHHVVADDFNVVEVIHENVPKLAASNRSLYFCKDATDHIKTQRSDVQPTLAARETPSQSRRLRAMRTATSGSSSKNAMIKVTQ